MNEQSLRELLDAVRGGRRSIDDAMTDLRALPFEDLGFAKVDHHRDLRCGFPEVIFCQGKSPDQVVEIAERCAARGSDVLATRATRDVAEAVRKRLAHVTYHEAARAVTLRQRAVVPPTGTVAIVAAGTSDLPVAEEARVTLEMMDCRAQSFLDVGVAGLHRLLAHSRELQAADVVIAIAGMEGALASVVGGLVRAPVIAVPTSVGYGASFGGIAALLAMLSSCAAGVTVVNIDNGFGAACAAAKICRLRIAAG